MAGFLPYGGGGSGLWSGSFAFSISAHAAMTVGMYALYTAAPLPEPLEERAAFTVTLEELDADSLRDTIVDETVPPDADGLGDGDDGDGEPTDDVASADPIEADEPDEDGGIGSEDPDDPEVETPDEVEVETPEEIEVETVEQIEPTIPEEFQDADVVQVPEAIGVVDGVVPDNAVAIEIDETATASTVTEAITPLAPVAPASPLAEPVELNPISPLTEDSPLTPDIAAPVTGDDGGLAPIAPVSTAVAPIGSEGQTTITSIAPNAGEAAPIAPVGPLVEQVAAVSDQTPQSGSDSTPQPVSAAAPSAQDRRLGALTGKIRGTPSEERCLIAIPRRDGDEGVGLSIISASEAAMETYAQSLLTSEDADIRQTRTLIDQRQCAALSYIAANGDYPATRMGISTEFTDIPSGENFTGVLRGTAGRYLTLLIIDDNGVVQDLQRFTTFSANLARFDVPVNRAGPPRDTQQILLAIATRRPPTEIREQIGRLAEEVFGGLPEDLTEDAALGLLTFDVR